MIAGCTICENSHLRYDTIRHAILTCAQKLTQISIIYRMEPTTKKWKKEKLKVKTDKLRSIAKQPGESVVSPKRISVDRLL